MNPEQLVGKVLQGTCGWTDASIGTCGRFYPSSVKTAGQRLSVYSRHFPCVEVDSSTYAIPKPKSVLKWTKQVLPGFKFHFKAFGLFCHQSAAFNTLPWQAKRLMESSGQSPSPTKRMKTAYAPDAHIPLSSMTAEVQQACWDAFHAALEPVIKAQQMGCVVFQFQLSFKPTDASRAHVLYCRQMLHQDIPMAVEFRNRSWFQDQAAMDSLVAWCKQHNLYLIAADELKHETYQKDRDQRGLPPGQVKELLPMSLAVTLPDFLYIRLHRRHGTTDRLLPIEEHKAWSEKLAAIAPQVKGPIYFLWGTDWEDAPVVNAKTLAAVLPPDLHFDYHSIASKLIAKKPGTIASFFSKAAASTTSGNIKAINEGKTAGNGVDEQGKTTDGNVTS